MTDITELAQSLKAEGISPERMEWLKKLADMKYCASNPGHWLMSLKETNYLAVVALKCIENNLALVEALEKSQQRIASQREYYEGVIADGGKRIAELDRKNCELDSLTQRWAVERAENADHIAELESRTVKLPQRHSMLLREDFNEDYHTEMAFKADEVQASLAAAGIKVEAE